MPDLPTFLILAGGLGTRIRSLVGEHLPKSMVPVNGQPFVKYQMELLAREGVQHVVFCLGHLSQPLIDYIGNGDRFGLRIEYSFDGDTLIGTAGAIQKASSLAGDEFAVLYGDSYLDIAFAPVYEAFRQSGKLGLTTVFKNDDQLIKSNMLFRDGKILAYEKSTDAPEGMVHVDFGLSFYKRVVFEQLEQLPMDLSAITQKLICEDQLAGYEVRKRFYEVGTPEGVRDLEQYLGT